MSRPNTPRAPSTTNPKNPTARTRLLLGYADPPVHDGPCNHGTFSPMPQVSPPGGASPALGPSRLAGDRDRDRDRDRDSIRSDVSGNGSGSGSRSGGAWTLMGGGKTTQALAEQHGVKNPTLTYWMYYIPGLSWMGRYKWEYLLGDTVAGGEFVCLRSSDPLPGVRGGWMYGTLTDEDDSHDGVVLYTNSIVFVDESCPFTAHTRTLRFCYTASGSSPFLPPSLPADADPLF